MEEKIIYINMWSPLGYKNRYLDFESKYYVQAAVFCGTPTKELQPIAQRVCRFCKKDSTQTEFRDTAHMIPDGIGNNTHFSETECHACNKLLGKYDNDLVKYLEPMRLFHWGTKKGGVYPIFNSPMKAAQVHIGALKDTEVIVFSRPDITKDTIAFDPDTSTMKLSFPLNPYSPRNIYLSLLKIGLSIIADDETGEYAAAYRYLIDNSVITEFNSLVTVYHLPIGSPLPPAAVLFRRKAGAKETPKHFLNLYVYNNIFTIPLIPNLNDLHFYNKPITIPPPILILPYPDDVRIGMENLHFKGDEVVKNHIVNLSMEMNKEELKNGVRLDPKTGQMTPVDFYSHLSSMNA
jgi:hypothetical protein